MSQISQIHSGQYKKDSHKWYSLSEQDVFNQLDSGKNGLDIEEVEKRLKKYGYNKLPQSKKVSKWGLLIEQFKSSLVYILLGAVVVSVLLGDFIDAGVIMLAVVINVIIGFYQENRAQGALESLRRVVVSYCKVLRDGHEKQIKTNELVPGDVVYLSAGDKIPADLRLFKIQSLKVNEAPLTGESVEVEKVDQLLPGELVLADQKNMGFMGTQVTQGNAIGVVVATGSKTVIGRIAHLVATTADVLTPLQHKLNVFSKKISILVLIACAIIFLVGLLAGYPFTQIFITSVAVAVSAIPEGLLVAVTMILAVGMQRILKRKALAKQLLAAEILGSTSVICADKTGTLTEGEMRVVEVATLDYNFNFQEATSVKSKKEQGGELLRLLSIGAICNNAYIENPDEELEHRIVRGSPTEKALLLAAANIGIDRHTMEKEEIRLDEVPFDSEWKYMMTLNQGKGGYNNIYLKGAPEKVIAMSTDIFSLGHKERSQEMSPYHRRKMITIYEDMSKRGLRVLACGYKKVSDSKKNISKKDKHGFVFVGLVAVKDPIRPKSKETIESVKRSGIKTVMITGDHKFTARAIAKELGLIKGRGGVMDGDELASLSESELMKKVDKVSVYARVSPEDKLKIVKAWQDKKEVVAMTGDGINDAPALKKANIGIAVGSGTDVAKETADLILLNDNFKTIVAAVKEGRVIYDNIKKVILYFLSDGLAEVTIIVASLIAGWPLPILASQIIWINLIDDTFPALALTQEPADEGIMDRQPNHINEPVLDKEARLLIGVISILSAIGTLFFFNFFFKRFQDIELARTVAFTFLAISTLFYVFSTRTLSKPIWKVNFFRNKLLIIGVLIGFSLQLLVVYNPWLQKIFETVPLGISEWLPIVSACLLLVLLIEVIKGFYYHINK